MIVSTLINNAFTYSWQQHPEIHKKWVNLSYQLGSKLPKSMLPASIQQTGQLDIILRCLENEFSQKLKVTDNANTPDFTANNLNILTNAWISNIYENFRKLKEILNEDFEHLQNIKSIERELKLIRVALFKHEIAEDKRFLNEPLILSPQKPKDENDYYEYSKDDKLRSHIMPSGWSEKGSTMWYITDLKNQTSYWVERQSIADKILTLAEDITP